MNRNGDYMENLFCSYEIALELKELGFDEPYLAKYFQQDGNSPFIQIGKYEIEEAENSGDDITFACNAPLYSQAIDWFREKHNIHIEVLAIGFEDSSIPEYIYQITDNRREVIYIDCGMSYRTYEEAREDGILKSITLLQKKK